MKNLKKKKKASGNVVQTERRATKKKNIRLYSDL